MKYDNASVITIKIIPSLPQNLSITQLQKRFGRTGCGLRLHRAMK